MNFLSWVQNKFQRPGGTYQITFPPHKIVLEKAGLGVTVYRVYWKTEKYGITTAHNDIVRGSDTVWFKALRAGDGEYISIDVPVTEEVRQALITHEKDYE